MAEDTQAPAPPVMDWRLRLGIGLFALSMLGPPVLLPLVTLIGLPTATTAAVSGGILIGAELLVLAAVAVMGKNGYAYIKSRLFGILKQYGPPQQVSRTRYIIGLVLFAIPVLYGWAAPYGGALVSGLEGNEIALALIGDGLLIVSLFVLGGDFWDKIRALFIHDARVVAS